MDPCRSWPTASNAIQPRDPRSKPNSPDDILSSLVSQEEYHERLALEDPKQPSAVAGKKRKATRQLYATAAAASAASMDAFPPSSSGQIQQSHTQPEKKDAESEDDDAMPRFYTIEEYLAMDNDPPVNKLKPLPVQKTTGEHAGKFNTLCQQHGLMPYFEFTEVSPQCFTVRAQFGEHVLENTGPFPSKRQAKEVISEQGIKVLRSSNPKKKRTSSLDENKAPAAPKERYDGENYIGLLQNWAQSSKLALPHYQEYEADAKDLQKQGLRTTNRLYAIALTVEGTPLVFGGEEALFESKQVARRHAAREAVLYLRATGEMAVEATPNKRQKLAVVATASADDGDNNAGHAGLTQALDSPKANETAAAQAHALALALNFTQPRYEARPSSPPPGAPGANVGAFVSMAAHFTENDACFEPRLAGAVAEVKHVFGKKRAREECAKGVVRVLEGIRAERLARARASGIMV